MKWYKSKTIWTGIVAIVTAVGTYFTGDIGLAALIQISVTSLIGMFLRAGVAKVTS